MSAKQIIEAGLVVSGAIAGAAGAALLEPVIIGAGVLAAGVGAAMRFADRNAAMQRS